MTACFKRITSLIVSMCLLLSFAIPVSAKESDISKHWALAVIQKWVSDGLYSGYTDGTYKPDNTVTKAELLTFINKVFNYVEKADIKYNDVATGSWYADCVSKATAADIVKADANGNISPLKAITRQEAALIISKAFKLKADNLDCLKNFTDSGRFSAECREAIAAMAEKGYIKGNPDKSFGYAKPVNRAEAVTMINSAMGTLKKASGTYNGEIKGNLTVNTKKVILKDLKIDGDLYLTQGIGDGDVTLENVRVSGKTYVFGGGANTVKIIDSILSGSLILSKKDGNVRILAQGTTEIPEAQLYSGGRLEEEKITGKGFSNIIIGQAAKFASPIFLAGSFSNVTAQAMNAGIQVLQGSVGNLDIDKMASDIKVFIAKDASVNTVTANSSLAISGQGSVVNANINSSGVVIEQKPQNVKVATGITSNVGGSVVDSKPAVVVPPAASGNNNTPVPPVPDTPVTEPTVIPTPIPTSIPTSTPTPTPAPVKPEVINASANNLKVVKIEFNKEIDPSTVTAFNIRPRICRDYAVKPGTDKKTVYIIMNKQFQMSADEFTIENVRDASGVLVEKTVKTVTFIDTNVPDIRSVTARNARIIEISASEPIEFSLDTYQALSYIRIDDTVIAAKAVSDYINNTVTLFLSSDISVGAHKIKIANLQDFAAYKAIAKEFNFDVPVDTAAPIMTEARINNYKEIEVTFNEAVDAAGTFTVNNSPATPYPIDGDFSKLKLVLPSELGTGAATEVTIAYKDQTDAVGNKVSEKKEFSFKTVNDTTVPLAAAYIDRTNKITLVFSKPMQQEGTVIVSCTGGGTKFTYTFTSISFKAGTNNTVIEIPAANTGLSAVEPMGIIVNIKGMKDASPNCIELPEMNIYMKANDTKIPVALQYYYVKAGTTAADDTVTFFFSEAMDKNSLEKLENYRIYGGQLLSETTGSAISQVATDLKSVTIKVAGIKAATDSGSVAFIVSGLKDVSGNMMCDTTITKVPSTELKVISVTATDTNKIEVAFNTKLSCIDPSVFKLTKGGADQAFIVAFVLDTASGTKVTMTLDKDIDTSFAGYELSFYNYTLARNIYDVTLTTSSPLSINDGVAPKANVSVSTTSGAIVVTFSEDVKVASTTDLLCDIIVKQNGTFVSIAEAQIAYFYDTGTKASNTKFRKMEISGLDAAKDYSIEIIARRITDTSNNIAAPMEKVIVTTK